jgi:GTP-binding protein
MPFIAAIVGRPNVGKSTLFNRLAGKRLALVDDRPGVTRDRREAEARLGDLRFTVIDTAGFEDEQGDHLAARIQAQTELALAEAAVALFLIDARSGLTPLDQHFAAALRRQGKPVILIANKCEGRAGEPGLLEAFNLGFAEPIPLSAEHGEGLADLYDALRPLVDAADAAAEDAEAGDEAAADPAIQLAIVGRPNVGKSTLVNRLIGEERLITGPEAGITRDAISISWRFQDRPLRLIDTAGLRRRAKVTDRLEALSAADTERAIRFAQVVGIVIDASQGLEKQDLTIARQVEDEGRAPLLIANKWDLVADRAAARTAIAERLETSLPQLRGLKVVPVSALQGSGVNQLLPAVLAVYNTWNRRITTAQLNRWLADITAQHPPPAVQGRRLKLRYVTQTKARPPTFALFVNRPDELPTGYLRYLAAGLRDAFGLDGVPLRLLTRRSGGRNPFAA